MLYGLRIFCLDRSSDLYRSERVHRIENLYSCILSEDSYDIMGFVVKDEDFFYTLDSNRHIIKGMANFKDIDFFIEKMT